MFKKILIALLLVVFGPLLVIEFFGDNLRALCGMSADSLAGDGPVTARRDSLMKKSLSNFGGGPGISFAPPGVVNPTVNAKRDALSTFAIDVDTASYTWARRVIEGGQCPAPEGVRVEEWVNAFDYELPRPSGKPFAVQVDGAVSPFDETKTLLRVALQGRTLQTAQRKPAHLVFLVDVSGSMNAPDKLPLARQALRFLSAQLAPHDTVALVTYAGSTRVVLKPTPVSDLATIISGIDSLASGGGTDMGAGMQLAYEMAVRDAVPGHTARVIVLTDGDANIGNTSHASMLDAVHAYVKQGVTLTTVGFGMGDYRADALEQLADKGNGQALYVDGEKTIERVFGEKLNGTLEVIARDVKVQVAFDPEVVSTYRLVGYENRDLADEDFKKDDVDAGELGAGHQVTALYELTLTSKRGSLGTVSVRGQLPDSSEVFQLDTDLPRDAVNQSLEQASSELRFATAVALGADLLRGHRPGDWTLEAVAELAQDAARGHEARREFARLMRSAATNRERTVSARVISDNDGY